MSKQHAPQRPPSTPKAPFPAKRLNKTSSHQQNDVHDHGSAFKSSARMIDLIDLTADFDPTNCGGGPSTPINVHTTSSSQPRFQPRLSKPTLSKETSVLSSSDSSDDSLILMKPKKPRPATNASPVSPLRHPPPSTSTPKTQSDPRTPAALSNSVPPKATSMSRTTPSFSSTSSKSQLSPNRTSLEANMKESPPKTLWKAEPARQSPAQLPPGMHSPSKHPQKNPTSAVPSHSRLSTSGASLSQKRGLTSRRSVISSSSSSSRCARPRELITFFDTTTDSDSDSDSDDCIVVEEIPRPVKRQRDETAALEDAGAVHERNVIKNSKRTRIEGKDETNGRIRRAVANDKLGERYQKEVEQKKKEARKMRDERQRQANEISSGRYKRAGGSFNIRPVPTIRKQVQGPGLAQNRSPFQGEVRSQAQSKTLDAVATGLAAIHQREQEKKKERSDRPRKDKVVKEPQEPTQIQESPLETPPETEVEDPLPINQLSLTELLEKDDKGKARPEWRQWGVKLARDGNLQEQAFLNKYYAFRNGSKAPWDSDEEEVEEESAEHESVGSDSDENGEEDDEEEGKIASSDDSDEDSDKDSLDDEDVKMEETSQ